MEKDKQGRDLGRADGTVQEDGVGVVVGVGVGVQGGQF